MSDSYERLFSSLPRPEVPGGLIERVRERIAHERARRHRTALAFAGTVALASAGGTVVAVRALVAASAASGFSTFLSLAWSDSATVASHASAFAVTLLETFPAEETLLTLGLGAIFFASLRLVAEFLKRALSSRSLTLA